MRRLFVEDDCKVAKREREREKTAREGECESVRVRRERAREDCRQLIGKQDAAAPPSHVRETPVGRKRVNRRVREWETGLVEPSACVRASACEWVAAARARTENWVCAHLQKMFKQSWVNFSFLMAVRRWRRTSLTFGTERVQVVQLKKKFSFWSNTFKQDLSDLNLWRSCSWIKF